MVFKGRYSNSLVSSIGGADDDKDDLDQLLLLDSLWPRASTRIRLFPQSNWSVVFLVNDLFKVDVITR